MARRTLAVAVLLSIGLSATAAVLFMKPRWSGRVHRAVDPPITEADAAHLAAFADSIGSAGLVVMQGGREVFAWGDVDVPRELRSIRKSVTNLVLGQLVSRELLSLESSLQELGIDDENFELNESERRATVRELMESRSGVYHAAAYETRSAARNRPERGAYGPGEHWYYNNWDFNVLETIAARAAGHQDYCETFAQYAAPPLGIEDPASRCTVRLESERSIHAAHPLDLTARDLATLARIFLDDGAVDGRRILPPGWAAWSMEGVSESPDEGAPEMGYGRLFWSLAPAGALKERSALARGSGGQYVWIVPELDAAVVHTVRTWPLYVRLRLGLLPDDREAGRLGEEALSAIGARVAVGTRR